MRIINTIRRFIARHSIWLGIPAILLLWCVYMSNGRFIAGSDVYPARFLPISVVTEMDYDMDEFTFIQDAGKWVPGGQFRTWPGEPWPKEPFYGHTFSSSPTYIVTLVAPLYWLPFNFFELRADHFLVFYMDKGIASLFITLSALFLFLALREVHTPRIISTLITIAYALGTSSWASSAQSLWQHGPAQCFIAMALWLWIRKDRTKSGYVWLGFAVGSAVGARPSHSMFAILLLTTMMASPLRATLASIGILAKAVALTLWKWIGPFITLLLRPLRALGRMLGLRTLPICRAVWSRILWILTLPDRMMRAVMPRHLWRRNRYDPKTAPAIPIESTDALETNPPAEEPTQTISAKTAAWNRLSSAEWRALFLFILGGLPAFLFLVTYNTVWFGKPWKTAYDVLLSDMSAWVKLSAWPVGGPGLLISPSLGLLPNAPFYLFLPLAIWIGLARPLPGARRLHILLPLTFACMHITLYGSFLHWFAGWAFAYRYLTDILPILSFLLFPLWRFRLWRIKLRPIKFWNFGWAPRFLWIVFCAFSFWGILIQAYGAYCWTGAWFKNYNEIVQPIHFSPRNHPPGTLYSRETELFSLDPKKHTIACEFPPYSEPSLRPDLFVRGIIKALRHNARPTTWEKVRKDLFEKQQMSLGWTDAQGVYHASPPIILYMGMP